MEKDSLKNISTIINVGPQHSLRKTNYRWIALLLACLLLLGDQYCFDIPQALESDLEGILGIDSVQFNMLYSVYSLPNIVLPLFGGLIVDKLGVRLALFLFSTLLMIGQGIVVLGGFLESFPVMIIGRLVFGMGSESLAVSQNSIISIWFRNQELALALGLNISFPKLGSAINSFTTPKIFLAYGTLWAPCLFGLFVCCLSFVAAILLILLDKKNSGIEARNRNALLSNSGELTLNTYLEEEQFRLKDVKNLKATFWILLMVYMLGESLFIPFLDNANSLYQSRFAFSSVHAGDLLIIPYASAAAMTPVLGILIDRIGKRGKFILLAAIVFTGTHFTFAILPNCSTECYITLLPLLLLGICLSLYNSAIMPSVPILIDERMIGTAFGIIGVLQNASLALFPMLVGFIQEDFEGDGGERQESYIYTSYFFMGCSIFLVILSIFLVFSDKKEGGKLDQGSAYST